MRKIVSDKTGEAITDGNDHVECDIRILMSMSNIPFPLVVEKSWDLTEEEARKVKAKLEEIFEPLQNRINRLLNEV